MARIIYVSDFSEKGSGYQRIGVSTCTSLANDFGHEVIALGLNYHRSEHNYPFRLVSVPSMGNVKNIVNQIVSSVGIDALVVALDVPLQKALLAASTGNVRYVGLFPIESPPISLSWASAIRAMDARIVVSKFAREELGKHNIESSYVPIPIYDANIWVPPSADERKSMRRAFGVSDDTFCVLTVADNQERKNLSAAMEIFAGLSVRVVERDHTGYAKKVESLADTKWFVITRMDSPVGYDLVDLAMRHGVLDRIEFVERGISTDDLIMYYGMADAFLLTSKAEGLAIPQLEAMAMKIPVVVTDAAAMREHVIESGCGIAVPPEYEMTDPFGNGRRYMIDIEKATAALADIMANGGVDSAALDAGRQYVMERQWSEVARAIDKAVKNGKA